mmetsp:Transcript_111021/g.192307  ORF Transcript_111021/g.192307 Transcript_111021/m.192307 type:complete len:84 (+) Transcript_111021:697-948(+)
MMAAAGLALSIIRASACFCNPVAAGPPSQAGSVVGRPADPGGRPVAGFLAPMADGRAPISDVRAPITGLTGRKHAGGRAPLTF